jgi:hypothetical protein
MGGVLQEEIFLKVRFQKWEGNSPTKSDFDFGRRTCRLCAIEGSFIQKQFQHLSCVHTIDLPFVPVFSFWNLRIQDRTMLPNEFALFLSDFLYDVPIAQILCVVQNIEVNRTMSIWLSQIQINTFRTVFIFYSISRYQVATLISCFVGFCVPLFCNFIISFEFAWGGTKLYH